MFCVRSLCHRSHLTCLGGIFQLTSLGVVQMKPCTVVQVPGSTPVRTVTCPSKVVRGTVVLVRVTNVSSCHAVLNRKDSTGFVFSVEWRLTWIFSNFLALSRSQSMTNNCTSHVNTKTHKTTSFSSCVSDNVLDCDPTLSDNFHIPTVVSNKVDALCHVLLLFEPASCNPHVCGSFWLCTT